MGLGARILEADEQQLVAGIERQIEALGAEQDAAIALELHRPRRPHLPGNLPLSFIGDVIDEGRDGGDEMRGFALRLRRDEAIGIFFRDEAGRQSARAPARLLHDRGEERNVVADAVDREAVECVRLRIDRGHAVAGMGDELGDHRVVIDRDLAAFVDAGVVADGDAVVVIFGRRAVSDQASGGGQEIAARDLRHRCGSRPPSP